MYINTYEYGFLDIRPHIAELTRTHCAGAENSKGEAFLCKEKRIAVLNPAYSRRSYTKVDMR
jgi:hypothetical protein